MAAVSSLLAAAVVGSTLASAYSANKQAKAQESATAQATEAAKKQASQAEEATNRANAKRPDTAAMASANKQASMAGNVGTMLTSPMGVDPATLQLGKNTLLGG